MYSASLSAARPFWMRAALAAVTPVTRVIFDDIVAVGPDGSPRQLDPMVFKAT